mgnify:CR=1 FL=1
MILMRKATPQKLFGVKSLNPHSDSTFAVSKNAAVMEHSRKSPTGCFEYTNAARRGFAKGPWSKYWCIVNGPNMIFHQILGLVKNSFIRGGKHPMRSAKSSVYNWKSTNPLTRFAS